MSIPRHLILILNTLSTYLYLSGNQARVADKSSVVSTSTRNFPNRLGKGANVFLASAELASISAIEGKLPTVEEYQKYASKINETKDDTFRYLNFDKLSEYVTKGNTAEMGAEVSQCACRTNHCSSHHFESYHVTPHTFRSNAF
jgi:Aconitase family (aconitate hydratase)